MPTQRLMPASRPLMLLAVSLLAFLPAFTACSSLFPGHATPTATAQAARPLWGFVWMPSAADQHTTAQAAFAASARASSPDGALQPPAAAYWLATGAHFALVQVLLDPAGQSVELAVLTPDPYHDPTVAGGWIVLGATGGTRPARGTGRAQRFGPITLPGGDYSCALDYFDAAPPFSALECLSPDQTFVLGRFTLVAERPASGATSATLAGTPGWQTQQGDVTSLVAPLGTGQTFVCAGTADPATLQAAAAQVLPALDRYLPA